jgi:release factor glutamine methyltransferase
VDGARLRRHPDALAVLLRRRWLDCGDPVTDVSREALALAADNLAHDSAGRVCLPGDLLLPGSRRPGACQPPYIPTGDIAAAHRGRSSPALARWRPDGLAVIRRLLARLPGVLARNGAALLEIGGDQEAALGQAVAELLPGWRSRVERDLSGLPRVAVVERPA